MLCRGTTPAFIADSYATVKITNSEELADSGDIPMGLGSVLDPNPAGIEKHALVFHSLEEQALDRINQRKLFAHFFGFIKYKDVFGREHETRFRYMWKVSDIKNLDGSAYGYWVKCGQESDNSET